MKEVNCWPKGSVLHVVVPVKLMSPLRSESTLVNFFKSLLSCSGPMCVNSLIAVGRRELSQCLQVSFLGVPYIFEINFTEAFGPFLKFHGLHGETNILKAMLSRRDVE